VDVATCRTACIRNPRARTAWQLNLVLGVFPMRRSIEVYAIAVCLVCMVGAATASSFAVYSVVELAFFETLHPSFVTRLESQRDLYIHRIEQARTDQEKESIRLEREQFERYGTSRTRYQGSSVRMLVRSVVWLCLCGSIFFVHWRMFNGSLRKDTDT